MGPHRPDTCLHFSSAPVQFLRVLYITFSVHQHTKYFFMQKPTTRSRWGRRILLRIGLLVLVCTTAFIVYDLYLSKPPRVDSGIARPHKELTGHSHQLWAVRFSPDGVLLASGGADSAVRLWSPGSGGLVRTLPQPSGTTTLDFSRDGKRMVTGSYDAVIRLWDVQAARVVKELKGHKGTVWSVVFSPDGRTLASAGEDKTVKLWDVESGALLRTLSGHGMNTWKVRFTPDGGRVVSSSFDRTIKVWNVADGKLLRTLEGHRQAVVGLAVSPDGRTLASASDDRTIRLWDLESGRLSRTLPGWKEHVYAVAFSPDGKRLVSGSRDNGGIGELVQNFLGAGATPKGITVRLWEVESGKLLQTLDEATNDIMDVAYSPDGQWIAGASTDHSVWLWRVVQ